MVAWSTSRSATLRPHVDYFESGDVDLFLAECLGVHSELCRNPEDVGGRDLQRAVAPPLGIEKDVHLNTSAAVFDDTCVVYEPTGDTLDASFENILFRSCQWLALRPEFYDEPGRPDCQRQGCSAPHCTKVSFSSTLDTSCKEVYKAVIRRMLASP